MAPPPNEDCGLAQLHSDVMAYEAAQALAFERIHYPSQLSTKLAAMLEAGAALTADLIPGPPGAGKRARESGRMAAALRRAAGAQRLPARRRSTTEHRRSAVLPGLDLVRRTVRAPAVRARAARLLPVGLQVGEVSRRPAPAGDRALDEWRAGGGLTPLE